MAALGNEVTAATTDLPGSRVRQGAALFMAALTVLLFYLAFPGGPAPWLGWMAMVPLGIALSRLIPRQAFLLTFVCAFFGWLVATWWVVPGLSLATRSPATITLPFEFLFCVFYALPYALAGWITARTGWMGSTQGAFKSALAWTLITYSVPHLLPGNLAHSQYNYPEIIQLVDLGGVPLLLFMMHWFNWLLVAAWLQRDNSSREWLVPLGLAALILISVCSYGLWRLSDIDTLEDDPATTRLVIGMLQPNLPVRGREREDWLTAAPVMETMTRQLIHQHPETDLVIWPEIPTPFSYSGITEDRERIDRLITQIGRPLLITDFLDQTLESDTGATRHYFNTMELVNTEGRSLIYRKQHLLPFGEYVPGEQSMPFLRTLFPSALHYVPGDRSRLFEFMPGISLIPMICYEAVFPELTRSAVEMGGNLLVNTVNDGWFLGSNGPQIHLALSLFRSVEFRVPMVRATNSGISVMIDAGGRIIPQSQLPEDLPASQTHSLAVPAVTSLYAMMGNSFLWLLWGLFAVLLIRDCRRLPCFGWRSPARAGKQSV